MTLLKRIKIPPAINQFSNSFDKRQASQLFRLLNNLKPETKTERSERLKEQADKVAAGGKVAAKKPIAVKMGVNHVTSLVEEKKAKLVIIAHDVDPIEVIQNHWHSVLLTHSVPTGLRVPEQHRLSTR